MSPTITRSNDHQPAFPYPRIAAVVHVEIRATDVAAA
jgi:hypothetical protein